MNLEPVAHLRAYAAEWQQRDGRLTGRCVPYDSSTMVLDHLPTGDIDIYREGFRSRAFERQVSNPEPGNVRRIDLIHSHEGGLGYLGPCIGLRSETDGLWADFRILTAQRQNVAELLDEGIESLSIEYRTYPDGTETDGDGTRWRTNAHLDRVALEPKGAYTEARVLAYRAELDEITKSRVDDAEAAARKAAEEVAEADALRAKAEAKADAAQERHRKMVELQEYLASEERKQATLREKYGISI